MKSIKSFVLSVVLYGVILYLLALYLPDWFDVKSTHYSVSLTFLILAIIFWIVNNIIKVILKVFTIPLKYLTFGLFSLVLNILVIYLFEYFTNNSSFGVTVHLGSFLQIFVLSLILAFTSGIIKKIT